MIKKLNHRSYRMGRAQFLTEAAKSKRLRCAREMLAFLNAAPDNINRILFSDEKWFKVGRPLNRQNHRQLLKKGNKSRYGIVGHQQHAGIFLFFLRSLGS